jgi:hypothetical protein
MKQFFALDKPIPNGQVEWSEWFKRFESQHTEEKETRLYKEKVAAARAAWGEAARSDPDKLNIDEFLTFTHPGKISNYYPIRFFEFGIPRWSFLMANLFKSALS